MHGIYSLQNVKYARVAVITSRTNPYGFPFFTSILHALFTVRNGMSPLECEFYGYVNADILLDPRTEEVLSFVKEKQLAGELRSSLLLVGRRTNINFSEYSSVEEIPLQQIRHYFWQNEQFMGLAMDYFLFTESTFSSDFLSSVVVGRDMIDSYIFHYCYSRGDVSVVDMSEGRERELAGMRCSDRRPPDGERGQLGEQTLGALGG